MLWSRLNQLLVAALICPTIVCLPSGACKLEHERQVCSQRADVMTLKHHAAQEPWGIVYIKAQAENFETPMAPITMLRNALGKAEGGSGVPFDRAAYDASLLYWKTHATVCSGEAPNGE